MSARQVYARIEALADEVAALRARVELLEQRGGARDATEAAVIVTIAARLGARRFGAAELIRLARFDAALDVAIVAADITNPRELGKLLARLENRVIEGLQLRRVDENRAGVVWSVQVSNSQTRAAE